MPHDIFVSHVEEDAGVAIELAQELERAGFTTWYYERDCLPGPQYLLQVPVAIDQARIFFVVISPHSLSSNQVTSEVVRAYEAGKPFVPLLLGITHAEFQQRQPVWRQALGASTSLSLPTSGLTAVFPRIIAGVRALLAASSGTSGTAAPLPQIQRPETADERFARLFAEKPDVIAEVEAEALSALEQSVADFERQLLRLEVCAREPFARDFDPPHGEQNLDRILCLIEKRDADNEAGKAFVSVSREPNVSYEKWHDRLQQYQRAIGGTTRIRETIVAMGPPALPLVCVAFRQMNSCDGHNALRSGFNYTGWIESELLQVMSRLRDFRALPFIADAVLRHADKMNGRNDNALAVARSVQAFGVDRKTVDACFERLVGISASEILREKRDRDKH